MTEELPVLSSLSTTSWRVFGLPVQHVVHITADLPLLRTVVGSACSAVHAQGLWPVLVQECDDYQCTKAEFKAMLAKHGESLVAIFAHTE